MCMSKGAPKKPAYGPCNEHHGRNSYILASSYYAGTTTADSGTSTDWSTNTTNASTGYYRIK